MRREGATSHSDAVDIWKRCRAAAEAWAEQQGVELGDVRVCNTAHYDSDIDDNPDVISTWVDWSEVGVLWTVDVGHATDDEWMWSARWEHWRAWFASMRMAAFARGFEQPTTQVFEFFEPRGGYVTGPSQDSDSVPVLFRDADARIVSALQDPNWGGEAVVDGDLHAVRIPINVDEPVKARTLADTFADPNLAGEAWADDES